MSKRKKDPSVKKLGKKGFRKTMGQKEPFRRGEESERAKAFRRAFEKRERRQKAEKEEDEMSKKSKRRKRKGLMSKLFGGKK